MVTEREILARLRDVLNEAVGCCLELATSPARGSAYRRLRENLSLAEGCCRSIAWCRFDARWLQYGLLMAEAHKRAGGWLREYPVTEKSNVAQPLFLKLRENLRAALARVAELETGATGRIGMILPRPARVDRTDGRPMQVKVPVRQSAGGILLP